MFVIIDESNTIVPVEYFSMMLATSFLYETLDEQIDDKIGTIEREVLNIYKENLFKLKSLQIVSKDN